MLYASFWQSIRTGSLSTFFPALALPNRDAIPAQQLRDPAAEMWQVPKARDDVSVVAECA
jgi:hypothetical protein